MHAQVFNPGQTIQARSDSACPSLQPRANNTSPLRQCMPKSSTPGKQYRPAQTVHAQVFNPGQTIQARSDSACPSLQPRANNTGRSDSACRRLQPRANNTGRSDSECPSRCNRLFWMHHLIVKPNCSILRTISVIILSVPIFRFYSNIEFHEYLYYTSNAQYITLPEIPNFTTNYFIVSKLFTDKGGKKAS